jgi:light-independent protochlorophyllide reductase subunit B
LFDTLVHPLVMGLEEHLLTMFREDFEFNDAAGPSHHGAKAQPKSDPVSSSDPSLIAVEGLWQPSAERELRKVPFFVRGKARRNTELFAAERGLDTIDVETLYEAKAHYAR